LVDGIVRATEYQEEPAAIFNLGNTHEVTILELARLIHELCGKNELKLKMVPYAAIGNKYEDVPRRIPDITRARTVLGFNPSIDLREGLTETIAWQKSVMGLA
jgi:UDP-glucose 4-epimerase